MKLGCVLYTIALNAISMDFSESPYIYLQLWEYDVHIFAKLPLPKIPTLEKTCKSQVCAGD